MTEEQLKAKSNAILDKLEEDGFDLGDWSIEDAHNNGFIDGYREGFKDCAKSRLNVTTISDCPIKDDWHYVKDGDLPKDEKDMLMSEQLILLTKMKGTDNLSISIGQYNFSTQEFSYQHIIELTEVIAWCEIPTFDKE